jgi:DNA polymerase theta
VHRRNQFVFNLQVTLETLVKEKVPAEATAALNRAGRWADESGSHSKAATNGCCRRVAQVAALWWWVKGKLSSEGLLNPLNSVEMPLVRVLGDMERWGVAFDVAACRRYRG